MTNGIVKMTKTHIANLASNYEGDLSAESLTHYFGSNSMTCANPDSLTNATKFMQRVDKTGRKRNTVVSAFGEFATVAYINASGYTASFLGNGIADWVVENSKGVPTRVEIKTATCNPEENKYTFSLSKAQFDETDVFTLVCAPNGTNTLRVAMCSTDELRKFINRKRAIHSYKNGITMNGHPDNPRTALGRLFAKHEVRVNNNMLSTDLEDFSQALENRLITE